MCTTARQLRKESVLLHLVKAHLCRVSSPLRSSARKLTGMQPCLTMSYSGNTWALPGLTTALVLSVEDACSEAACTVDAARPGCTALGDGTCSARVVA